MKNQHTLLIITKEEQSGGHTYSVPGHQVSFVSVSSILNGTVRPEDYKADAVMVPKGLKSENSFKVRVWAKQTMLHKPHRNRRTVVYG